MRASSRSAGAARSTAGSSLHQAIYERSRRVECPPPAIAVPASLNDAERRLCLAAGTDRPRASPAHQNGHSMTGSKRRMSGVGRPACTVETKLPMQQPVPAVSQGEGRRSLRALAPNATLSELRPFGMAILRNGHTWSVSSVSEAARQVPPDRERAAPGEDEWRVACRDVFTTTILEWRPGASIRLHNRRDCHQPSSGCRPELWGASIGSECLRADHRAPRPRDRGGRSSYPSPRCTRRSRCRTIRLRSSSELCSQVETRALEAPRGSRRRHHRPARGLEQRSTFGCPPGTRVRGHRCHFAADSTAGALRSGLHTSTLVATLAAKRFVKFHQ